MRFQSASIFFFFQFNFRSVEFLSIFASTEYNDENDSRSHLIYGWFGTLARNTNKEQLPFVLVVSCTEYSSTLNCIPTTSKTNGTKEDDSEVFVLHEQFNTIRDRSLRISDRFCTTHDENEYIYENRLLFLVKLSVSKFTDSVPNRTRTFTLYSS